MSKDKPSPTLFTIQVPITEECIFSLLVAACEGGSNYWYFVDRAPYDARTDRLRLPINCYDELEDPDHAHPIALTLEKCHAGLAVLRDKYPWHFNNAIDANGGYGDAETGDVFLQCALFGNIIYG